MSKFDFSDQNAVNLLNGDLGETFYKHYSRQQGFAYIRPEAMSWELLRQGKIRFKKGFHRIDVEVPEELLDLLINITIPNKRYPKSPSYRFDFLSCMINDKQIETHEVIKDLPLSKFAIVEIKTGKSDLTPREDMIKFVCEEKGIKHRVFRISNINAPVREWDFMQD